MRGEVKNKAILDKLYKAKDFDIHLLRSTISYRFYLTEW